MGEQDSEIIEAIRKAFELFHEKDLTFLYKLPFEAECDKDRKLHEVCLNHKLAEKLSARKLFSKTGLYVDIEFNRKGGGQKLLDGDLVRPDIIIHNRKDGDEKFNWLVVECKKESASSAAIQKDRRKVQSFITSEEYAYQYGLCVIYNEGSVRGELYKRTDFAKADFLGTIEYPPSEN